MNQNINNLLNPLDNQLRAELERRVNNIRTNGELQKIKLPLYERHRMIYGFSFILSV